MPIHNWKRVEAGIFHAFHHRWISAIGDALNAGLLPDDYYALPEQFAGGLGPDVLTLQGGRDAGEFSGAGSPSTTMKHTKPQVRFHAETEAEFYHQKKSSIVVRHVSGDRVVAVIEIVSFGNKTGKSVFRDFMEKVLELVEHGIHLLIVDLFPPTRRDPRGIHSAIWEEMTDEPFQPPADKPLTLVSYECGPTTGAYIEPAAVGDPLKDMPLYLEPETHILVPLEATYATAFAVMPKRWKQAIEA